MSRKIIALKAPQSKKTNSLPQNHKAPIYYMENYEHLKTPSLECEKIDQNLIELLKDDKELENTPIIKKNLSSSFSPTPTSYLLKLGAFSFVAAGLMLSVFLFKASEEGPRRQITTKSQAIYVDLK